MKFLNPLDPENSLRILLVAAAVSTTVCLLAMLGTWLWRRASAARKHLIWLSAFIAMAVCAPLGFLDVRVPVPILPAAGMSEPPMAAPPDSARIFPWPAVAFGAWALGPLLSLLATAGAVIQLRRLRKESRCVADGTLFDAFALACAASGVRNPPLLLLSAGVKIPLVTGLLRVAIVLPEEVQGWPAHTLRAALLHEIAHLLRGDLASLTLARIVASVYWFNPLAWHGFRRLRTEAEMAADDHVVIVESQPVSYAESLVGLARGLKNAQLATFPAIGILRNGRIEARVGRILDGKLSRTTPPLLLRWALVLAACVVAFGISVVKPVAARTTAAAADTTRISMFPNNPNLALGNRPAENHMAGRVSLDKPLAGNAPPLTYNISDRETPGYPMMSGTMSASGALIVTGTHVANTSRVKTNVSPQPRPPAASPGNAAARRPSTSAKDYDAMHSAGSILGTRPVTVGSVQGPTSAVSLNEPRPVSMNISSSSHAIVYSNGSLVTTPSGAAQVENADNPSDGKNQASTRRHPSEPATPDSMFAGELQDGSALQTSRNSVVIGTLSTDSTTATSTPAPPKQAGAGGAPHPQPNP